MRATILYLLLRVVASIGASEHRVGGELGFSLGVVFLAIALGQVDLARRGERILWSNLAYTPMFIASWFGGIAIVGELALAVFSRAV